MVCCVPLENLVNYEWRGAFTNQEVNELHADAFETRVFPESEWNWRDLVTKHSLGWVTARDGDALIGFVNVLWDGLIHAWIQDVMVATHARRRGIGVGVVSVARDGARAAGCEWLHVDFDDDLRDFYYKACGFTPSNAGVISLAEGSRKPFPSPANGVSAGGGGPKDQRGGLAARDRFHGFASRHPASQFSLMVLYTDDLTVSMTV
jgi:GNAT superfamily N-acetyltransferase